MKNIKVKNLENGITLVALIITIIILIILVAVTINVAFKSNFIEIATSGTENYANEQLQEQKMMDKLADQLEKTVNAIENIQEGITNNSKIEFSINTEKYTFDEVEITIIATAPQGETITNVEPVDGNEAILKEGNTYIVNKNGEYSFKVTTSENKTDIATQTIKNILQAPEIIVSNVTETSLDINIQATYPEDLVVQYEYYVDGAKKGEKTTDKECKVSDLVSSPDHTVKVLAYISDDNYKEFEEIAFIDLENITNLTEKKIDKSKIEYIYKNGVVNADFGEVKLKVNIENNSIEEFMPHHIICQTSSRCNVYNAQIGTTNPIDLSKYESLNAVIKCLDYKEGHFGACIYSGDSYDGNMGYTELKSVNMYPSFPKNKLCIISCDITKNGVGYPTIHYTYDKFVVYQIFLVKK